MKSFSIIFFIILLTSCHLTAMDTLSGEVVLEPKKAIVKSGKLVLTLSQDDWFFYSSLHANDLTSFNSWCRNNSTRQDSRSYIHNNCAFSIGSKKYMLKTPDVLTNIISELKPGRYRKETMEGVLSCYGNLIGSVVTINEHSFYFSYKDGKSDKAVKTDQQNDEVLKSSSLFLQCGSIKKSNITKIEDILSTEQISKGYGVLQAVVELAKKYETETKIVK